MRSYISMGSLLGYKRSLRDPFFNPTACLTHVWMPMWIGWGKKIFEEDPNRRGYTDPSATNCLRIVTNLNPPHDVITAYPVLREECFPLMFPQL